MDIDQVNDLFDFIYWRDDFHVMIAI